MNQQEEQKTPDRSNYEIQLENVDLRLTGYPQFDSLHTRQGNQQDSPLILTDQMNTEDKVIQPFYIDEDKKKIQASQFNIQNKTTFENEKKYLIEEDGRKYDEDLEYFYQEQYNQQEVLIKQKDENHLQQSNLVLLKRKLFRIILLIILEIFIIGMFLGYYYDAGFHRGEIRFTQNDSIILNIKSCVVKINDYSDQLMKEYDINFISTGQIPSEITENILLMYSLPKLNVIEQQSFVEYNESDEDKILTIENAIDFQSCQVNVFIYKQTQLKSLKIECYREDCFIMMHSKQLEILNLDVQGYSIDFTSNYLKADELRIESYFGYIELNEAYFTNSYLDISTGDISIQSTISIEIEELETVNKFICLTSYVNEQIQADIQDLTPNCIPGITLENYNFIKNNFRLIFQNFLELIKQIYNIVHDKLRKFSYLCLQRSYQFFIIYLLIQKKSLTLKNDFLIKVYPFRSEEKSDQNVVAYRCYKGTAIIKSAGSEPNQKLKVKNTFGNIFVNILEKPGDSAEFSQSKYFDQTIYGNSGNNVDLSVLSKQQVEEIILNANNPKIYDPVFLLVFGSKYTQSSTFTQWQITYNPAYSYLKPWWLGTLSYTLLSTQFQYQDITLAPGFCPYVPSLTKDRLISTQKVLEKMFIPPESQGIRILTLSWLRNIVLPPLKFFNNQIYTGKRDIQIGSNYSEEWISFQKDQDSTIFENFLQLEENNVLLAALIVSLVLAVILGLVFMIGIVYVINTNYLYLLDFMKHVDTYSILKKQNINLEIENENEEINVAEKEEEEYVIIFSQFQIEEVNQLEKSNKQILTQKTVKFKYSISGICNLFFTLVYLSPPLSAYMDQVALLLQKARTNSIQSFYSLLFQKVKQNEDINDESIHNLEKDSIQGQELKNLYEQYCYVNRLLERKLDDTQSQKFLQQRGFKISLKQDTLISYYTYIKYNGLRNMVMCQQKLNSLDKFIKSCCKLTKFDCDTINSQDFETYYKNHLQVMNLNEKQLKKDYGIDTIQIPQQVVERDQNYIKSSKVKYVINKNRVKSNFKILLLQDITDINQEIQNYQELNYAMIQIYSPKGWFFYDFLAVITHLISILIIGSPAIILIIFIRVQQFPFTLIPFQKYLQKNDLLHNFSLIPSKLMNDNNLVQTIFLISLIFWVLCTWDLIYYYCLMNFPQERYFQNYIKAQRFRKFISRVMWIIVLFAIYFVVVYMCLTITWLILSAIINPEAFLPYASSAATFVTLVGNKYKQFKEVSDMGFDKLLSYIRQLSSKQFQDILKKMDIIEKIEGVIPTDHIKSLLEEASNFNLIDPQLSETIQNNLEIMVRDPNAVIQLGQQVQDVAQNPQLFAVNLMTKCEDKVKDQLSNIVNFQYFYSNLLNFYQKMQEYLPFMYQNLIQTFYDLMLNAKSRINEDLIFLFRGLQKELINSRQLSKKQKNKKLKQIKILQGPLMRMIQDLQNKNSSPEEKKKLLAKNICSIINLVINFRMQENSKKQKDKEKKQSMAQLDKQEIQQQKIGEQKQTHEYLMNKGDQFEFQDGEYETYSLKQEMDTENQLQFFEEEEIEKTSQELNKSTIESAALDLFYLYQKSMDHDLQGLLQQILISIQNYSKINSSEELLYLNQMRGIFQLYSEIMEEQGLINTRSVYDKFQSLFSQKIFKDNFKQKVSLEDLLTLLTNCVFSSKNLLQLPEINKLSILCFELQQNLSEKNRINNNNETFNQQRPVLNTNFDKQSSLISFYLYWQSNSLFNLPQDTIKDLLNDLSTEFNDYKHINNLISANYSSSRKSGVNSSKNMKKTQQFFNLIDIMLNNPNNSIQRIKNDSQNFYGAKNIEDYLQLMDLVTLKYKSIIHYSDLKALYGNKLLQRSSNLILAHQDDLLGIILMLTNRIQEKEVIYFLKRVFQRNQIQESRIQFFKHLYGLVSSEYEEQINTCLNFFNFSSLRLISYDNSNQRYSQITQEDVSLILLFLQGHYGSSKQGKQRVITAFENIFCKKFSFEQINELEQIKILVAELKISSQLIELQQIKQDTLKYQSKQQEISKGFKALISIKRGERISSLSLSRIIKLLTLDLLGDMQTELKYHEIQIFTKLISLKNLKLHYQDVQQSILKESQVEVAQVINCDETNFFKFLSLISSNSQQLYQIVLDIMDTQSPSQVMTQYVKQCLSINNELQQKYKFVEEIQSDLFHKKIPLHLLRELILFDQLPQDSETMFFILQTFDKIQSPLVRAFINYKYGIQSVYKQQLKYQLQEKIGQFEEKSNKGFNTLLQIFNNSTNSKKKLKLFLQYLYDSKQEIPLLFTSLCSFLSINSEDIEIQVNQDLNSQKNQNRQNITVVQYLSKRLDIKSEFFEVLYQFQPYTTSSLDSIRSFIKYFRQVDYQIQKQEELDQKVQQIKVDKFQPNVQAFNKQNQQPQQFQNIRMQSVNQNKNILNRVTITEYEVEQFFKLITSLKVNTQFLSGVFQIPYDVAEFLQFMFTSKNDDCQFNELTTNASCKRILSKVGVLSEELITFMKYYNAKVQDNVNIDSQESLQKDLKTSDSFAIICLQNIHKLKMQFNYNNSPLQLKKLILNKLKTNKLVKDMNVNTKYLTFLFCLKGYFKVLGTFSSDEVTFLQKSSKQSIQIQNSLLGQSVISIIHLIVSLQNYIQLKKIFLKD